MFVVACAVPPWRLRELFTASGLEWARNKESLMGTTPLLKHNYF